MNALGIVGEVVTAATALAGLILVYLGSLASAFDGFEPDQKSSVRRRFTWRAWLAFVGMVVAILAGALAIVGGWLSVPCLAGAAVALLLIAFLWGIALALLTVLEIR